MLNLVGKIPQTVLKRNFDSELCTLSNEVETSTEPEFIGKHILVLSSNMTLRNPKGLFRNVSIICI